MKSSTTTTTLIVLLALVNVDVSLSSPIGIDRPRPEYEPFLHIYEPSKYQLGNWLTCDLCKFGVGTLQKLFEQNATEAEIVDLAIDFCIVAKIEDKRVCQLVVPEFKDEVLTVFAKLVLSPNEVCGILIGDTCGDPYNPDEMWNITLPPTKKPPVKPPAPPKPGSPVSQVLHLSDIHLDRWYQEGFNAECGEPLCCRANDGPPATPAAAAGKWGDYRNCDTPLALLENLFQHLSREKFDYVLWTGDLPAHDVWNQSRADQLEALAVVTQLMLKYFPNTTIYPALGNHESAPVNSFPPPYITGDQSISWLYQALVDTWVTQTGWLPANTTATILKGGYYRVPLGPGLWLVSLNMNMCNDQNWWLLLNETDPTDELAWLIGVLQGAEDNKEKVYIIGHIPPGSCGLKAWSWNYYKIVDRYESTIVAQVFGHTHDDSFQIFYDLATLRRPTSVAFLGPSVTTYSFLNPGYKIYQLDGLYPGSSFVPLNFQVHYTNLTEANLLGTPQWSLEYSAKDAYAMKALLPTDWQQVVETFKRNDTMFRQFYRYKFKMNTDPSGCDPACKNSTICDLQSARAQDPSLCTDLMASDGLSFSDIQNYRRSIRMC